jgi:hypothetical protein
MAAKLPNLRLADAARAAEALLLAIVGITHAAGWFALDYLQTLGTAGSLLAEALPFASLSLLALWIPLGPGSLWLRGAASPLLAWFIYQAAWSTGPTDWTAADRLLASVAVALLVVALALRACGVRMVFASPRLDAKVPQFSVRGLLIVTTFVALCIGGLEAARPWLRSAEEIRNEQAELMLDQILEEVSARSLSSESGSQSAWPAPLRSVGEWTIGGGRPRHALMAAILVLASLLATWTVLRPGAPWLRAAGSAICIPAAGMYLGPLTSLDPESTLTMAVWITAIGLLVGLSVAPLRLMSYRVVRPCIAATSGRASGSAGASPSQALRSQTSASEHVLAESHS